MNLFDLCVAKKLSGGSGGTETMIVELTIAEDKYVANKTGEEILTALIVEKKEVILLVSGSDYERYFITNAGFSGPPGADYFITAFTAEGYSTVYIQAQRDAEGGGALFARNTG